MHTVTLENGETVVVPDELAASLPRLIASMQACHAGALSEMADSLATEMHAVGLIVVPRAGSNTREAVTANLYSLALAWKNDVERRMRTAADLLFPVVMRDDGDGMRSHDLRDMLAPIDGDQVRAAIVRLSMAAEILRPDLPARPEAEQVAALPSPDPDAPAEMPMTHTMVRVLYHLMNGARLLLCANDSGESPGHQLFWEDLGGGHVDTIAAELVERMETQNFIHREIIHSGTAIRWTLTKRGRAQTGHILLHGARLEPEVAQP